MAQSPLTNKSQRAVSEVPFPLSIDPSFLNKIWTLHLPCIYKLITLIPKYDIFWHSLVCYKFTKGSIKKITKVWKMSKSPQTPSSNILFRFFQFFLHIELCLQPSIYLFPIQKVHVSLFYNTKPHYFLHYFKPKLILARWIDTKINTHLSF